MTSGNRQAWTALWVCQTNMSAPICTPRQAPQACSSGTLPFCESQPAQRAPLGKALQAVAHSGQRLATTIAPCFPLERPIRS
eukprot:2410208-Prorocentrum_lima.AAC.1